MVLLSRKRSLNLKTGLHYQIAVPRRSRRRRLWPAKHEMRCGRTKENPLNPSSNYLKVYLRNTIDAKPIRLNSSQVRSFCLLYLETLHYQSNSCSTPSFCSGIYKS